MALDTTKEETLTLLAPIELKERLWVVAKYDGRTINSWFMRRLGKQLNELVENEFSAIPEAERDAMLEARRLLIGQQRRNRKSQVGQVSVY